MGTLNFLPAISIALYDRALKAADSGYTCNVILLCAASMEGFINEYIELGTKYIEIDKKNQAEAKLNNSIPLQNSFINYFNFISPKEVSLINELNQHEKDRKNIFVKINTIIKHCSGTELTKDKDIYRDYCTLVKIRNDLTHPRAKLVEYGNNHIPKYLVPFYQQKKISYFNDISPRQSWVEAIDTVNFSKWCVKAFEKMMVIILGAMWEFRIYGSPKLPNVTAEHAYASLGGFKFDRKLVESILLPLAGSTPTIK